MKVVFLTMVPVADISLRMIYTDLLRTFVEKGHQVYIVSPRDRRMGIKTYVSKEGAVNYLGVRTLNLQKTNVLEKGLGQVLVPLQFKRAIKTYWKDESFDLILYSTPPITLHGVVEYLKKANPGALSYLLLKDIFPQNAVDMGMISKSGLKGFIYRYFRRQEKALYRVSDYIGCMSPANVSYLLEHNPEVNARRVEVAPNSIERPGKGNRIPDHEVDDENYNRYYTRDKYNLPKDKPLFVFGGNLGRPQGIPFLIRCIDANKARKDCFFVIVGDGTELPNLMEWYESDSIGANVRLIDGLPKTDYDILVKSCDVGLVFLDYRFTIPNFPSRMLSYLENKMPIICATDPNCDMGRIAEKNGFGYWCESNSVEAFTEVLDKMISGDIHKMGEAGYEFLLSNYLTEHTYNAIMRHF